VLDHGAEVLARLTAGIGAALEVGAGGGAIDAGELHIGMDGKGVEGITRHSASYRLGG
jgi:hypothetical protein